MSRFDSEPDPVVAAFAPNPPMWAIYEHSKKGAPFTERVPVIALIVRASGIVTYQVASGDGSCIGCCTDDSNFLNFEWLS